MIEARKLIWNAPHLTMKTFEETFGYFKSINFDPIGVTSKGNSTLLYRYNFALQMFTLGNSDGTNLQSICPYNGKLMKNLNVWLIQMYLIIVSYLSQASKCELLLKCFVWYFYEFKVVKSSVAMAPIANIIRKRWVLNAHFSRLDTTLYSTTQELILQVNQVINLIFKKNIQPQV